MDEWLVARLGTTWGILAGPGDSISNASINVGLRADQTNIHPGTDWDAVLGENDLGGAIDLDQNFGAFGSFIGPYGNYDYSFHITGGVPFDILVINKDSDIARQLNNSYSAGSRRADLGTVNIERGDITPIYQLSIGPGAVAQWVLRGSGATYQFSNRESRSHSGTGLGAFNVVRTNTADISGNLALHLRNSLVDITAYNLTDELPFLTASTAGIADGLLIKGRIQTTGTVSWTDLPEMAVAEGEASVTWDLPRDTYSPGEYTAQASTQTGFPAEFTVETTFTIGLQTPQNLFVLPNLGYADISWNAVAGVTGYTLRWREFDDPAGWESVNVEGNNYTIQNLELGGYITEVRANYASGSSEYSDGVAFSITRLAPPAPAPVTQIDFCQYTDPVQVVNVLEGGSFSTVEGDFILTDLTRLTLTATLQITPIPERWVVGSVDGHSIICDATSAVGDVVTFTTEVLENDVVFDDTQERVLVLYGVPTGAMPGTESTLESTICAIPDSIAPNTCHIMSISAVVLTGATMGAVGGPIGIVVGTVIGIIGATILATIFWAGTLGYWIFLGGVVIVFVGGGAFFMRFLR